MSVRRCACRCVRRRARGPARRLAPALLPFVFLAAGALLIPLVSGCSQELGIAVGSTQDVGLVTPFELSDERVGLMAGLLERPVEMVRPEERFAVHPFGPSLFKSNRDWKTLVFLVDLDRLGPLSRQVHMLLSDKTIAEMRAKPVAWRVVRDVWARGQAVLVVHARDAASLRTAIGEHGATMMEGFEEGIQAALEPALLAIGEQTEMERYLERNYRFTLRIPKDYLVAEDPPGRVVRLYRVIAGEPARFLLIHWGPEAEMPGTDQGLLDLRDRLGNEYYDGDRVYMERAHVDSGTFQGQPARILRGIWQNQKYAIGGPFRSYVFTRGDRFFLIDVSVYNPPGDKLPYLREVQALARTFRTTENP